MTDDNELARNKDVVRRYVDEVWNGGQVDLIPELVHGSFCGHHERNRDEDIYGIEALRARVEAARQHLPDLRLGVILALAEGDRVMVHLDASGTYRAPTSNQAAGRTLTFTVTGIMRVAEGRIAESWVIYDTLGALQQLGVVASLG